MQGWRCVTRVRAGILVVKNGRGGHLTTVGSRSCQQHLDLAPTRSQPYLLFSYAKNKPSQIHLPVMSENDLRRGDIPADVAERLRAQVGRFRILIIGRANAGKTTILQKVCNTTEDPEIFNSEGNKVDLAIINPSRKRGVHDINHELVFRSNPGFIFHDSRGFESGGVEELDAVKNFITERAQEVTLSEQLHIIWYCLPMDNDRLVTRAEEFFFNECGTGKVPVILVFTRFDGFVVSTFGKLLNQINDVHQAFALAQNKATADFERLRPGLDVYKHKYPPKSYVCLQDMTKPDTTCKDLIEQSSLALDDRALIQVFVSTQQSMSELCTKHGIQESLENMLKTNDVETSLTYMAMLNAVHLLGSKSKAIHIPGGQSTNKNWIRKLKNKITKKKIEVMPETLIKVSPETLINIIKENTLGIVAALTLCTND
ncbi:hypothetical protein D9615_008743 [Tricholomella constricta]|uniref:G domain-containing protein n=1 Tax=Tricholomella constricta TaxID=117010 RepID=A0A8H5M2D4_9AGAR|nr:hypothetical protein D9615_008743 [Tricholomella constricta]